MICEEHLLSIKGCCDWNAWLWILMKVSTEKLRRTEWDPLLELTEMLNLWYCTTNWSQSTTSPIGSPTSFCASWLKCFFIGLVGFLNHSTWQLAARAHACFIMLIITSVKDAEWAITHVCHWKCILEKKCTYLVEGSSSLVSLGFPLEISFWIAV